MDTLQITIKYDYAVAWDYEHSEQEIGRESSVDVCVAANNTPLAWTVSGTGFSLEHEETEGVGNILHANETACGPAKITVIGCDGQSATGYVRCTTGQWANRTNGCIMDGAGATYLGNTAWELIRGKYKQRQRFESWYGLGSVGEESCGNVDCGAMGAPNCVSCLDLNVAVMWPDAHDCGNWCRGQAGCGPYPPGWDGGYCIRNMYCNYDEWTC